MTVEEALKQPGRKLLVSSDGESGQRIVTVYSVADGGAKQIAATTVPAAEHDALVAKLQAGGGELAESEDNTRIVWVISGDHIEAFDQRSRQLDASGDSATTKDGKTVKRSEIAQVFSWASDDYAHRGIKAALRSGDEVRLVTEISLAATGDPTYGRNELLFDSGWCTTLGRAIATWAGVEFENKI